ncbi:alpha/beta fold hydrolase [Shewanella maritima]|uniref:alpha/beta fold hydrolase n=1 Tax=Shewanella maritima TaxID=2520507 RepID=UPI003734DC6F
MHVVSHGQGDPVIIIHGLFGNLDNLKNLALSLESHFTVYRFDVTNHGDSEHSDHMDYLTLADDFIHFMDQHGISKAHFVGHSMGGKIAMAIALQHPQKVSGLVVADIAPVAYQPRHGQVFNALTTMPFDSIRNRSDALAHMKQMGIDDGTAQFLLKNLKRIDSGFEWKMNLDGLLASYDDIIGWPFNQDNKDQLWSPYLSPCLFIRGGDSDYVQASHREQILAQFPQVTAKTLNGTGHWLHAQKPVIFNRLINEFFTQKISKN